MKFPKHNPFAQGDGCFEITFDAPPVAVIALEDAFEDIATATASFEATPDGERWQVQIITAEKPLESDIAARAERVAEALDITLAPPRVRKLEPDDWRQELSRDFPPLVLGRYFVHGAHAKAAKPVHAKGIQLEAGMAFGSGEHATTSGCLLAIDALAKRRNFSRVLDMGCGSGILAIAAAQAWPRSIGLGVDVDAVSARIAQENIVLNRQAARARAIAGNGYASRLVQGQYDLILANILARPLVKFSHALATHLAPGGVAVLSGLLASQEIMVLAAHRRQGLKLKRRIVRQGWATLVLEK